jgi:hypothetical protein
MVALSKQLNFAFMAGSSLPTAWRMPPIDMPYGADVEEALTVSIGGVDSYDFHALDALQVRDPDPGPPPFPILHRQHVCPLKVQPTPSN